MDVRTGLDRSLRTVTYEDGFTLIESLVAMGLFTGVVFLLVTVFSGFMLDDFPSRSLQAMAIAQKEITSVRTDCDLTSAVRDTAGFLVERGINIQQKIPHVTVTVRAASRPSTIYAKLTIVCALK